MKKLLNSDWLRTLQFTVPFNNMETLKFKAQPTKVFFATVNQRFGSSSQLPTMLSDQFELITTRAQQWSEAGKNRQTFDWR